MGIVPTGTGLMPSEDVFSADKVAPSLEGYQIPLDEYGNPDESYLFDENHEKREPSERFGLNEAQVQELYRRAKKAIDDASMHWEPIYRDMEDDFRVYAAKDMWSNEAKAARAGRPQLSFPILKKFVKRTVGDTMRNPPGVKLSPRDDDDFFKAEIGNGLIRYIEDSCGAKYSYTHGFNCSVIGGLGWLKGSFSSKDRKILIKRVEDPLFYMLDPESQELDGSDAMFVVSNCKKTKNKHVTECYEYWWKERKDENSPWEVYWCLFEGMRIVDYGHFPGEIIPIFPIFGEVIRYRDEHIVKGIVRDLKDAQDSYNYLKSQEIEVIALTPKAPIIAEEGTIPKEYLPDWNNCTKNPTKVLFYRNKNLEGETTPNKPEFLPMKADTQWAEAAAAASLNDLKEITGIYDTALGSDNKELSGKAIIAKQITADAGQYSFTENLQMTLQQVGRWIVGMIKPVMGTERVIRILGEDGKLKTVDLDRPMGDMGGDNQEPMDLDFSEMDLSISAGNAYATRRERALDMFQDLMQAMPQTAAVLADLVVKNMDFDEADEASRRLHAMLPPEVQNAEKAPKGFVPAAQLQQAIEMCESIKNANMQLVSSKDAQIKALEAELQNQYQARVAGERIKGEYALANTALKEFGQNERKALDIQEKAESDTARMQADMIKTITGEAAKAQAASARSVPGAPMPGQGAMQQPEAPKPGLDVEFKDPTISSGNMNREDMLMQL